MIRIVVDLWNQRKPDNDVGLSGGKRLEVVENLDIRRTGHAPMARIIQVFEVKEEQIGAIGHAGQGLRQRSAAAVDRRVDAKGPAAIQQGHEKIGLHQRFAARKRHAAAGLVEEDRVSRDLIEHARLAHDRSNLGAGVGRTPVGAFAAPPADGHVDHWLAVDSGNRAPLAVVHTREAADAPVLAKHQFRCHRLALRAMTPRAPQRAPLEKHRRANPRAIMHGEALDLEDVTGHEIQSIMAPVRTAFVLSLPKGSGVETGFGSRGSGFGVRKPFVQEAPMKNICWTLILLAALSFVIGTYLAFARIGFLLGPQGYWRGTVGILLFAIALRLMDDTKR